MQIFDRKKENITEKKDTEKRGGIFSLFTDTENS